VSNCTRKKKTSFIFYFKGHFRDGPRFLIWRQKKVSEKKRKEKVFNQIDGKTINWACAII
jgi:hypothetical protein